MVRVECFPKPDEVAAYMVCARQADKNVGSGRDGEGKLILEFQTTDAALKFIGEAASQGFKVKISA